MGAAAALLEQAHAAQAALGQDGGAVAVDLDELLELLEVVRAAEAEPHPGDGLREALRRLERRRSAGA